MENNTTELKNEEQFKQEQEQLNNDKKQWEKPDLQKVEKLEILDI